MYAALVVWRRSCLVLAGLVAGLALLAGAVLTLKCGYALAAFSSEKHLPAIVSVALFRRSAAHVAASAASIAVVVGLHGTPANLDPRKLRFDVLFAFATILPITPLVCMVALLTAAGTAALVFGFRLSDFWSGLWRFVTWEDPAFGLMQATAYAVPMAVIAILMLPFLLRTQRRLHAKVAIAWITGAILMGGVDVVFNVALDGPEQNVLDSDQAI